MFFSHPRSPRQVNHPCIHPSIAVCRLQSRPSISSRSFSLSFGLSPSLSWLCSVLLTISEQESHQATMQDPFVRVWMCRPSNGSVLLSVRSLQEGTTREVVGFVGELLGYLLTPSDLPSQDKSVLGKSIYPFIACQSVGPSVGRVVVISHHLNPRRDSGEGHFLTGYYMTLLHS